MADSRLVFSTAVPNICKHCHKTLRNCICENKSISHPPKDGVVRIGRETKGRKGKGVTLVSGVALPEAELKELAKQLKTHCGAGGSIKEGIIEIQGDHRTQVQAYLEKNLKQKIKLAGG